MCAQLISSAAGIPMQVLGIMHVLEYWLVVYKRLILPNIIAALYI